MLHQQADLKRAGEEEQKDTAAAEDSADNKDTAAATEDTEAKTEETADAEEDKEVSKELVIYSSHKLEFLDPLVMEFESQTGIEVEVIAAGTGELLTRIEAESANPQGDIMWGGTISALTPDSEYFEPYVSENDKDLFKDFQNVEGKITRFTAIPSVIIVNTNLAGDLGIDGYESLLNPELKGKIANCDPEKSSSSFEQVVNQLYAMGEGDPETGWDYVEKLIEQLDGKLLDSSSAVPKGVSDGEYFVGLTYEMGAAEYYVAGAPVEIIYPVEGTNIKPDCTAIIKGAKNLENAKTFIDFTIAYDTQAKISSELNRRPVRADVEPAEGLKALDDIYLIFDDLEWVAENKENILEQYRDIFTR